MGASGAGRAGRRRPRHARRWRTANAAVGNAPRTRRCSKRRFRAWTAPGPRVHGGRVGRRPRRGARRRARCRSARRRRPRWAHGFASPSAARGTRAYLALARRTLHVPVVLGSRSTELGAGLGGFGGRALRAGDRLAIERLAPPTALPSAAGDRPAPGPADRAAGPVARAARAARRSGSRRGALGRVGAHAVLCDAAIQPRGVPAARRRASDAGRGGRDDFRRDGDRGPAGAARRAADPADGRPAGDRRLSDDCDRDHLPTCRAAAQLAPGDWIRFESAPASEALAALRDTVRTVTDACASASGVPLAGLTTLGVGGPRAWFVTARQRRRRAVAGHVVPRARRPAVGARRRQQRRGGGRRLRRTGAADRDLCVAQRHRGATSCSWTSAPASRGTRRGATGGGGLAGVECLSGIPGTVGGTPIQNVGAYGQEVAAIVDAVQASIARAASGGRWRPRVRVCLPHSRFKGATPGASSCAACRFRVRRGQPTTDLSGRAAVARDASGHARRGSADVRAAVLAIRRRRGWWSTRRPRCAQRRILLHEPGDHRERPRRHWHRRLRLRAVPRRRRTRTACACRRRG